MIRTIIIEDELDARKALAKMLKLTNPNIDIIAKTGLVSEAKELIAANNPDLILLDIELEDGNGFDLLESISDRDFRVIFTTAYSQFAIKAFKYSATSYLLKPISPIELQEAVEKSIAEIKHEKEYHELLQMMKETKKETIRNIVLKTADQRFVVAVDNIIRLEADAAYTSFVTKERTIIISKNLKYYQDLLDDTFIRCHQSHLVNSKHIKSFKNTNLILSNDEAIPISTRRKANILKYINSL